MKSRAWCQRRSKNASNVGQKVPHLSSQSRPCRSDWQRPVCPLTDVLADKMLHDARMAAMRKLQHSVQTVGGRRLGPTVKKTAQSMHLRAVPLRLGASVVTFELQVALQANSALRFQPIPHGSSPAVPAWGIGLLFPIWQCVVANTKPTL
jgi:hypothetical protein